MERVPRMRMFCVAPGSKLVGGDVHAGDAALDRIERVAADDLLQVLAFDRRDGTGDFATALRAVADRHDALELHGLRGELEVGDALSAATTRTGCVTA